ncbi:melatonin receptor type 1B-A-like [Symsagittifera roscoffensis]|uniref:melatonin receptor type 1B-A-like n=1 Tax=Symsagittifera roscoffensis TaxID=84072 RepID=UPI00307BE529
MEDLVTGRLIFMRYFTLVWLLVMTVLGVPGNLLVLASLVFMSHLRQLAHLFLANLALFDLGVMFMNCIALTGVVWGDSVMRDNPVLCEVSGIICMVACFGSLWTMMFVAINRFIFICKNEWYSRLFGMKGTLLSLLVIWVCVCLLDLANYPGVGYGGHTFNPPLLHCSFTLDNSWWYNTIIYTGVALTLPIFVISYCYYHIWRLASKRSGATSEKRRREQRQLLLSLLTLLAAFVVTWSPLAVVLLLAGITPQYNNFIPEGTPGRSPRLICPDTPSDSPDFRDFPEFSDYFLL